MQNQDREKAANRPIEFGLKLLGYNLFYRLPGLRDLPVGRRIGRDYLTRKYLRLPVEDLSSEILENPAAVCDVTDSLFLPVLGKRSFFQQVEKALDCPGFAKARLRLEDPCMGMEEIYQSLNRTLQKSLQPDTELKMAAANLMPNRYIIRLLDIAVYHGVTVHLTIDSSYPREFYLQLLKKNHIGFDTLAVSWKEKRRKLALVQELGLEKFGAVTVFFALSTSRGGVLFITVHRYSSCGIPGTPSFLRNSGSGMMRFAGQRCSRGKSGPALPMNWDTSAPVPCCTVWLFWWKRNPRYAMRLLIRCSPALFRLPVPPIAGFL